MKFIQDIHVHTSLSSCARPEAVASDYVRLAKEAEYGLIAFTDHLWGTEKPVNGWYAPQNLAHVLELRKQADELRGHGVEIRFGAECEYDFPNHDIAITEEACEQLEHILAPNSHTHIVCPRDIRDDYAKHADFMMRAFYDILGSRYAKYVTAIPHPFAAVACPYPRELALAQIHASQFHECFTAARDAGIAVELNSSVFEHDAEHLEDNPFLAMFEIAKDCGCKFTYGSDKHTAVGYGRSEATERAADLLGLTDDDMLLLK